MIFEHWIYSAIIAIIIYTIYKKIYVLSIIVLSAYAPDIDYITNAVFRKIGISVLVYGQPIRHGDFHNIGVLLIYTILIALLLRNIGIKVLDSFILASIGFGAHLFEDALVFNPGYSFFWPISDKIYGIGILKYKYDLYGIADKEVLAIGLVTMILCIIIRNFIERRSSNKTTLRLLEINDVKDS